MKLQVKCPKSIDKLTECYWEGKLGDLEDHQKKDDECPMPKGIMMNLLSSFISSFACSLSIFIIHYSEDAGNKR